MILKLTFLFLLIFLIGGALIFSMRSESRQEISGAPPYGEPESAIPELDRDAWLKNWQRPDGPPRVGLQVGHWKNNELPPELSKLIGNTGAQGGGKTEAEVNLTIAQETAELLTARGVEVDILPATVPPGYWADAFIAIHADGSEDAQTNGFKIAPPWRDFSGNADYLAKTLTQIYQETTQLREDQNVTRNMRGYYAFSWWRYEHAVHPMTTSVIVETGFLTSPRDRNIIVDQPQVSAQAIAQGVIEYLQSEALL